MRDQILPAMLANKAAILADPESVNAVLQQHAHRLAASQRSVAAWATLATLPEHERHREVIMFGEHMWPRVDERYGVYDYDQLCTAIWTFEDMNRNLYVGTKNAHSRAITIRNQIHYLNKYFMHITAGTDARQKINAVRSLITRFTIMLEQNPEAQCKMPPTPIREDEWLP